MTDAQLSIFIHSASCPPTPSPVAPRLAVRALTRSQAFREPFIRNRQSGATVWSTNCDLSETGTAAHFLLVCGRLRFTSKRGPLHRPPFLFQVSSSQRVSCPSVASGRSGHVAISTVGTGQLCCGQGQALLLHRRWRTAVAGQPVDWARNTRVSGHVQHAPNVIRDGRHSLVVLWNEGAKTAVRARGGPPLHGLFLLDV